MAEVSIHKTLRVDPTTIGYYNIPAGSFGLRAGVQTFSCALFFVTNSSLTYLQDSNGWWTRGQPQA